MELPSFLSRGTTGEIRVTGHRIDLYLLVEKYNEGYTAEMLHREYPTVPLTLIQEVIDFYLNSRAEVDEYVAALVSKIEKLRTDHQPGPGMLRIRKILEERAHAREKA
jgi:uncharacterized protein (DUF433 family)